MPTAPMVLPDWSCITSSTSKWSPFLLTSRLGLPVSITRVSSSSAFLPIRTMFEVMMTFSVLPGGVTCMAMITTSLCLTSVSSRSFCSIDLLVFLRRNERRASKNQQQRQCPIHFLQASHFTLLCLNVRDVGIPLHYLPNELQGELHHWPALLCLIRVQSCMTFAGESLSIERDSHGFSQVNCPSSSGLINLLATAESIGDYERVLRSASHSRQ